ncbi:MAG TPA: NAD+ synthase [Syntrophorhabdales bacterium]|nr:NAD+ synthase [Syntrophorhabdales bacterium]
METTIRIALAQINCTVGDLNGNCRKILEYAEKAERYAADIVSFPELAVTGYPPEDLLLKPKFVEDNVAALQELSRSIRNIVAVVGFVDKGRRGVYNSAAVISAGEIKGIYHKMRLPNYAVFDEKRYFNSGKNPLVFLFGQHPFGVNICEDIWMPGGPTAAQARYGARFICNINASPYHAGKIKLRQEIIETQARNNGVVMSYTNMVGGQDELVFDGQSMVIDKNGTLLARAEAFKEDLLIVDVKLPEEGTVRSARRLVKVKDKPSRSASVPLERRIAPPLKPAEEVYQALLLGLRDYVQKNGFKKVVLGLSGGIDSALVTVLAADALGKENVMCVFMPSRFSSEASRVDARELCENLDVRFFEISIERIYDAYLETLSPNFSELQPDITEENIQARIRGNIIMALSNKFGWLVLTTGNKSEMSVGYATLYGDMAGGFAVIKDVPKTLVYRLCRWRNSLSRAIPERVLTKAPSAELKPDQKDTDTLPPYDTLDPILKAYVEEDEDAAKIIRAGYDPETVNRVIKMVDMSEYKRRQSPPGIRITPKAFGKDRRVPITNKYKG